METPTSGLAAASGAAVRAAAGGVAPAGCGGAGVTSRPACFSGLSRRVGDAAGRFFVEALAQLVEFCVLVVVDLVDTRAQLRQGRAEVAVGGERGLHVGGEFARVRFVAVRPVFQQIEPSGEMFERFGVRLRFGGEIVAMAASIAR